jgi:diguanylate cyclase (GGDEF)-like protein
MRNLALVASALFVVALCAALLQFQVRSEQAVSDGILTQARAHAREFNAVRAYVQGFTGIYVPASKDTTVNPHLKGIEGVIPQMVGPKGKQYVLQNAPIVASQVSRILEKDDTGEVVRMRMLALKPLNPDNEPTGFALTALKKLQGGAKEVHGFGRSGGTDVFRYALGVPANKRCGKCHENLKGKTKGVVGLTMVEMDVTRPLQYVGRSRSWTAGVIGAVILISIIVVYVFITRVLAGMYRAQTQVYEMARKDGLTGLASRHVGLSALERELDRALRQRLSLACCVIDLDDFKRVNDDLGHNVGDRVLEAVGHAIAENMRSYDVAARVGGEEFLLVVPGVDASEARYIGNRIREQVADVSSTIDGLERTVTCTVGIAILDPFASESAREIFVRADEALLMAKRERKDRVVLAPPARHDGAQSPAPTVVGPAGTKTAQA